MFPSSMPKFTDHSKQTTSILQLASNCVTFGPNAFTHGDTAEDHPERLACTKKQVYAYLFDLPGVDHLL